MLFFRHCPNYLSPQFRHFVLLFPTSEFNIRKSVTKYILRVRKKRKPCRKNCPDKTDQFSNLRQICIKSVFANFKHNHGVQIYSIWCINKRSRSPRHIFRSSRLSLEYPDTFFTSSGNFPVHPYTF